MTTATRSPTRSATRPAARSATRRAIRCVLYQQRVMAWFVGIVAVLATAATVLVNTFGEVQVSHLQFARTGGLWFEARLDAAQSAVGTLAAQVRALSPAATLERGYAVLRFRDGSVLRTAGAASVGDPVEAILRDGRLDLRVEGVRLAPAGTGVTSGPATPGPSD